MVKKLRMAVVLFVFLLGMCFFPQHTFASSDDPLFLFTISHSNSAFNSLVFTPSSLAHPASSQQIVPLQETDQLASLPESTLVATLSGSITPSPVPTDIPTPPLSDTTSTATIEAVALSPTSTPTITPPPVVTPAAATNSLNADYIFSKINEYRTQAGLASFVKDDRICQVAVSRAPELYNEIMVHYNMHAGFYARNLPYWATENIIYMRTEDEALQWWLHSPVHRAAIFGDYKYSCVACSGNACSEIFTNFEPK